MKIADVKIGSVYLTRIGAALAPVRVVSAARPRTISYSEGREGPARFYVQRIAAFQPLPKPRTASALREVPFLVVKMKDQPWEVRVRQNFEDPLWAASVPFEHTEGLRPYNVEISEFNFQLTSVPAQSAPAAGVLAARAMVAGAVFEAPPWS